MGSSSSARALIVLDRTEVTPRLIDVGWWRARRHSGSFALLVPQLVSEDLFGDQEAHRTLQLAVPALEEATRAAVTPMTGPPDALLSIQRALVREHFVEVILSTPPDRIPRWLGRDLAAKVERLGVPVTVVTTNAMRRPLHTVMQFGGA